MNYLQVVQDFRRIPGGSIFHQRQQLGRGGGSACTQGHWLVNETDAGLRAGSGRIAHGPLAA